MQMRAPVFVHPPSEPADVWLVHDGAVLYVSARLRAQTVLNTQFSADAFVQYVSTADRVAVNARLRSNFGEGRDLWLVCDERFDTGTFGRNRSLPRSDTRTFTLKVTYTFGV